jgi:hypothetical protein
VKRRDIRLTSRVAILIESGFQLASRAKCMGFAFLFFWDADGIHGAYDLTLIVPFLGITLRVERGA